MKTKTTPTLAFLPSFSGDCPPLAHPRSLTVVRFHSILLSLVCPCAVFGGMGLASGVRVLGNGRGTGRFEGEKKEEKSLERIRVNVEAQNPQEARKREKDDSC